MPDLTNPFFTGLIFLSGLALALLLVPQVTRLARKTNAIDHPGDRKIHNESVPRLGGLAIAISFLVTSLVFLEYSNILWALLAGFCIILITGLIDDIWQMIPVVKFTGEILAALVFLLLADVAITSFGDLVGTGPLTTGRYAIPVSIFCMVGVINALNLADGLDGLAGGISAIGCVFLACFAWMSGQSSYLAIVIALLGSVLGFLYYNRYPARIFMGDTGSLVLGYLLSAVCILLVQDYTLVNKVLPVSMATVLGLPIVDAMIVMTNRMLHGKNPFSPDNTHIHHRLMDIGFSHQQTVLVIYAAMISCGLLAVLMRSLSETIQFAIGVIYATMLFGSVYVLQHAGFKIKSSCN
jgi:UDP-GlcNAc:undecaprenyl-phosphate/decaprenyl-phosphate GlcNAc-1-phosphate transferase